MVNPDMLINLRGFNSAGGKTTLDQLRSCFSPDIKSYLIEVHCLQF